MKAAITLPKLEYFITYRNDYNGAFFEEIALLCRELVGLLPGLPKENQYPDHWS